jgi:hypothetical protein
MIGIASSNGLSFLFAENRIMSRVVFIANIPYDMTETQLTDIFSEVGSVQSLRLVFDHDTGRPKGIIRRILFKVLDFAPMLVIAAFKTRP